MDLIHSKEEFRNLKNTEIKSGLVDTTNRKRKRKLTFLSDKELKDLVDEFGFSGAAKKIKERYKINVVLQTVRNECKKRGIDVSAKDCKDGLYFEILVTKGLEELGIFKEVEHIGTAIGNGVDIYALDENNKPVWIECRNWNYFKKIDVGVVKDKILPRFKGKKYRKILVHSKKVEFTKEAKELLDSEGIEFVYIANKKLTTKNWGSTLKAAVSKLGAFFKLPVRAINNILLRLKQTVKDGLKYWNLTCGLVESGVAKVCNIDEPLGVFKRVKSKVAVAIFKKLGKLRETINHSKFGCVLKIMSPKVDFG